ncbi:hypothetical protein HDE_13769 [Halotydeus destructor]|nr:hypothetical protein HDE_13769 [Halotydeus destructor]
MELMNLSDEILTIIISKLRIQDQWTLIRACHRLKDVVMYVLAHHESLVLCPFPKVHVSEHYVVDAELAAEFRVEEQDVLGSLWLQLKQSHDHLMAFLGHYRRLHYVEIDELSTEILIKLDLGCTELTGLAFHSTTAVSSDWNSLRNLKYSINYLACGCSVRKETIELIVDKEIFPNLITFKAIYSHEHTEEAGNRLSLTDFTKVGPFFRRLLLANWSVMYEASACEKVETSQLRHLSDLEIFGRIENIEQLLNFISTSFTGVRKLSVNCLSSNSSVHDLSQISKSLSKLKTLVSLAIWSDSLTKENLEDILSNKSNLRELEILIKYCNSNELEVISKQVPDIRVLRLDKLDSRPRCVLFRDKVAIKYRDLRRLLRLTKLSTVDLLSDLDDKKLRQLVQECTELRELVNVNLSSKSLPHFSAFVTEHCKRNQLTICLSCTQLDVTSHSKNLKLCCCANQQTFEPVFFDPIDDPFWR